MMKKISLFALIIVLNAITAFSQRSFLLSEYMMHQPFINPASISGYQGLNGALVNRNQWVGFDGAPTTQGLNINTPIKSGNNSIGLTVMHDKIGVNRDISISGSYAYKFKVNETSFLSLGLSATLNMLQSNFSELQIFDQNDNIFSADSPTFMKPNFSFGAYYFKSNFYIGAAIPSLLSNKITYNQSYSINTSFEPNELHYYLHSGYKFIINNNIDLNTSFLLKSVYGAPLQADINTQLEFNKKLGVGFSYRTSKDIVGLISFQVIKKIRLAYSYDYNFSELSNYSSGSHEVMMLFNFYEQKSTAIIESPRF